MSVTVSGIMINPVGEPVVNAQITLTAVANSLTVLNTFSVTVRTDNTGAYRIQLEEGSYSITVAANGRSFVYGAVTLDNTTGPSTLNQLLKQQIMESELTPDVILYFRQIQQQVANDLATIKVLENSASNSAISAGHCRDEAKQYATDLAATLVTAKGYRDQAGTSANAAVLSQQKAGVSEISAKESKNSASLSEQNALSYRNVAQSAAMTAADDASTLAAEQTAEKIKLQVKTDTDRAEAARNTSEQIKASVENTSQQVAQQHSEALQAASAAKDSENNAADSSGTAQTAAVSADQSKILAVGSAETSHQNAIATTTDKNAAKVFRDEAEEFASQARDSAESIDISDLERQIQGKVSTQQLTDSLSGKAAKGANNDITELNTLTKPIAIAQGGSGSKTAAEARSAFGLGSAATLSSGKAFGNLLPIGTSFSAQLAGDRPSVFISSAVPHFSSAISTTAAAIEIQNGGNTYAAACMMFHRVTQYAVFFGLSTNNRLAFGGYSAGPYQYDLITQQNSTVDSNGFYKAASPVIKLFGDGTSETNPESEGATSGRISKGVYKISGVLGFNSDESWGGPDGGIEIPLDKNKQALIWVDYKVTADGDLLIKTYHRTHPLSPEFARNIIEGCEDGQLIDIPAGRFVDLRVQMPQVEKNSVSIDTE